MYQNQESKGTTVIDETRGQILDPADANDMPLGCGGVPGLCRSTGVDERDDVPRDGSYFQALDDLVYAAAWAAEDAEPQGDLTPAEFVAYLAETCPGVPVAVHASQFVYVGFPGDFKPVDARYEATVRFPGTPMRHVASDSFRSLAALIVAEYRERQAIRRRAEADRVTVAEAGMAAAY
jgi:hypothetical protein